MSENEEIPENDTLQLSAFLTKLFVPADDSDPRKQLLTSADILTRVEEHFEGFMPQDVYTAMEQLRFPHTTINTHLYWLVKPL